MIYASNRHMATVPAALWRTGNRMKISIDPKVWQTTRFEALCTSLGWTKPQGLGTLTLFWYSTRAARIVSAPLTDLAQHLTMVPALERPHVLLQLAEHRYLAQTEDGKFTIEGNAEAVATLIKRSTAAKLGHIASNGGGLSGTSRELVPSSEAAGTVVAPKKRGRPRKAARPPTGPLLTVEALTALQEACRQTWEAYRDAFSRRHGIEPTRNGRVSANIQTFVQRVGQKDAPEVIRFYVAHNDAIYVRQMHHIGAALKDAESLHAQWRRGKPISAHEIAMSQKSSTVASQLARIQSGEL
jgi:hypothetical protein